MRGFVSRYKTDPRIRELALSLTRNLPQKDFQGEINVLYSFVQNHIRYIKDIDGVETVQSPIKTLEYGQGDCDDKAVLLATLLASAGHKTQFKAIGFSPGKLSHVIVEVQDGPAWVALETTMPVQLGWHPKNVKAAMTLRN